MHFLDANSEKNATFQRFWPIFVRFWPLFYTPATVTTLFMVVFDSRGIIVNEIGGNSKLIPSIYIFVVFEASMYQQITGLSLTQAGARCAAAGDTRHKIERRKKKKRKKKKKEEEKEKEKEKKEK